MGFLWQKWIALSLNLVVVKGSVFAVIITAAVVIITVVVAGVLDSKVVVDYSNSVALLPFLVVELNWVNLIDLISFIIASSNVFASILLYEQIFLLVKLIPF